jgi:hypothetical protein
LDITVAANRAATEHGALIIIDRVAVITFFIVLNDAITAARRAAVDAAIGAAINAALARVTSLPRLHNPITAARQRAGVGAHIVVDCVAIITGFIRLDKTIAADGAAAERRARRSGAVRSP